MLIKQDIPEKEKVFIVTIGFWSGWLHDVLTFFDQISHNPNAVFVIIQHLWRYFSGIAYQLLAKHTDMPVIWAADHLRVRANHIHMPPVNS